MNKGYKKCLRHSPVSEFLNPVRKYICLLDDNVFACPEWEAIFEELNKTGRRFQFKQGLDERLLTDRKCEVLFGSKWIGDYIFAFDNIKDKDVVERKLAMIRRHTSKVPKFYTFCAYNHESPGNYSTEFWGADIRDLFERIRILFRYQALPYVMRYKDYETSPYRGMYITISRWCNQPSFAKKCSMREFAEKSGATSLDYIGAFERDYPEIAEEFYDMKWSDFL